MNQKSHNSSQNSQKKNMIIRDANSQKISFSGLHRPILGLSQDSFWTEYLPIMTCFQSRHLAFKPMT